MLYALGEELAFFTRYHRLLSNKDLVKRYKNSFLSNLEELSVNNLVSVINAVFEYLRIFESNMIIYRKAERLIKSSQKEIFQIILNMYKEGFILNNIEVPRGTSIRRYGLKADYKRYRSIIQDYIFKHNQEKGFSVSELMEHLRVHSGDIIFIREYKDTWNIVVNKRKVLVTDELIDRIEYHNIEYEIINFFYLLGLADLNNGLASPGSEIKGVICGDEYPSEKGKTLAVINNDLEIMLDQKAENFSKFCVFAVSELINLDRLITARLDRHKYISAHKYGIIGENSPILSCAEISLSRVLKQLCASFPDTLNHLITDWNMAVEDIKISNGVLVHSSSSLLMDRIFLIRGIDKTEIKKLNSNYAFVPIIHFSMFKHKLERNDINFIEKISQVMDEEENIINLSKNEILSLRELLSCIEDNDMENARTYFYNLKRVYKVIREVYEN